MYSLGFLLTSNRFGQYATKEVLKRYIPELDPKHERAVSLRIKMAKRTAALRIQLATSLLVFILNASLLAYLLTTYPIDARGVGTFTYGDCSDVSLLNSSLHVALNIASSLFLATGNYCMQILVAPSREEAEKAERKGHALEIGVPSFKNLRHIYCGRAVIWASFGILSTLLHLL